MKQILRRLAAHPASVLAILSWMQTAGSAAAALAATALLPPAERGAMVVVVTLAGLVALVAGMGSGGAVRSMLPRVAGATDREAVLSGYTALIALGWATATLGTALLLSCATPVPGPTGDLVLGGALLAGAQFAVLQTSDLWFAAARFKLGAVLACAGAIAGLLGLLVAATITRQAGELLLAQAGGSTFVSAVGAVVLYRAGLLKPPWVHWRVFRGFLSRGAPSLGVVFGLAFATRVDRFILAGYKPLGVLAVYALAATLSELARVAPAALGQVLSFQVASRSTQNVRTALWQGHAAALVVSVLIFIGGSVFIVPIFGQSFADAVVWVGPLCLAEVLLTGFTVCCRGLIGGGWTGRAGAIGIAGAVLSVATAWPLIAHAGVWGAIAANGISYAVMSLLAVTGLRRASELPQEPSARRVTVDAV